jgi:hypothetical protein
MAGGRAVNKTVHGILEFLANDDWVTAEAFLSSHEHQAVDDSFRYELLARFRVVAPHRGVDFLEPLFPLELIVGCSMAAQEYSMPAKFVALGDEEEAWLLVSDGRSLRLLSCAQKAFLAWRSDPEDHFFGRAIPQAELEWEKADWKDDRLAISVSDWLSFLEDVVASYSEVCRRIGSGSAERDLARLEKGLRHVRDAQALLQSHDVQG